jgi:hypothetical protein
MSHVRIVSLLNERIIETSTVCTDALTRTRHRHDAGCFRGTNCMASKRCSPDSAQRPH